MNENPHPQSDPLENWLAGQPALTPAGDLEQAVLQQTRRVLRRRRWLRRTGLVTALAACYVAGLLTMRFLPLSPVTPADQVTRARMEPLHKPDALPYKSEARVKESPPPRLTTPAPVSPLALEWQAVDSREPRPDLYRQAGDRYLQEDGDIQSAVRCYRNMLKAAPEEAATISVDDNWLLMALKDAQQKEKRRGKTDG